jgi:hypothetical protein
MATNGLDEDNLDNHSWHGQGFEYTQKKPSFPSIPITIFHNFNGRQTASPF